ncbi:hypothetical protein ACD591_07575 [Rufibacter glacialis]|uniref:Uncharacterized protein n=1 Tax=Rufibacter glacialis TaxID=1259555 RepID=A0ABV4RF28_9BACT|nr:hypothetical protein [Rufibacter glacialis]
MIITRENAVPSFSYIRTLLINPFTGLAAASHHAAQHDDLNGYCLFFYTTPKAFIS